MSIFSLGGRTAFVTGATGGLGLEVSISLAKSGATVVASGRDSDKLDSLAREIRKSGGRCFPYQCDLARVHSYSELINDIEQKHGSLRIVVGCAGLRFRSPVEGISEEEFNRIVQFNLTTNFLLARAAALAMRPRRDGRIIMMTSIAGQLARSGDAAYTASKGGLSAMVRSIAAEFGPDQVTCNAIAPGFFATLSNEMLLRSPEVAASIKSRVSLQRAGNPSEIGGAAVFLASDAASYINGHTLIVDGGLSARM